MSDLDRFLRDTSVYALMRYENHNPLSQQENLLRIAKALQAVSSHILDLDSREILMVSAEHDDLVLHLGALGSYHIPTTPTNMSQVANRFEELADSPRFVKAVLGYWPA